MSDVITSVLATCHENAVNGFEYLNAVQRNRAAVRASPERWLPWNYSGGDGGDTKPGNEASTGPA